MTLIKCPWDKCLWNIDHWCKRENIKLIPDLSRGTGDKLYCENFEWEIPPNYASTEVTELEKCQI